MNHLAQAWIEDGRLVNNISILAIIWASVIVSAFFATRTKQTPILWFLFFGALLVNTGILPQQMPPFIDKMSDLGIILIMFALGFEEDTNNFVRGIKRSWGIALFGALVPFAIAYSLTFYFWNDSNISLLCGLAMTATAVSLTMATLKNEKLHRTPAATGIMTSAILDDIGSLAMVAILIPVATGGVSMSASGVLWVVAKTFIFFALIYLIGRWLFPHQGGVLNSIPILKKINLRNMLAVGKGKFTVLVLILMAVLIGLLAHEFGFHLAIGAYMAGLIIKREYFDIHVSKKRDFHKQAVQIIDDAAFAWIGPIFFVTMGTKITMDLDLLLIVLPDSLLLFGCLFIGQIASAGLAAKYTGNYKNSESLLIGFGMLGRAELALVVLNIAFVQYQLITIEAFSTMIFTMTLLNFSVPISIKWWKAKEQKIDSYQ